MDKKIKEPNQKRRSNLRASPFMAWVLLVSVVMLGLEAIYLYSDRSLFPVALAAVVPIVIVVFRALIAALERSILARVVAAGQEQVRSKMAIAELFAAKRKRSMMLSSVLIVAMIIYGLYRRVDMGFYLGGITLILLWADQLVLAYRIRCGYYATNQHEAREFLRFLVAHADKGGFSDTDGSRKIFPTPEEIAGSGSVVRLPGYAEA
jgi:hypothetical protein